MYNVKQVIVIRKDLKMRRGKEIAQGSHASISFLTKRLQQPNNIIVAPDREDREYSIRISPLEQEWLDNGFAKICLRVTSEEELLKLSQAAEQLGVEWHLIEDSGHTEFNMVPTKTCLALGPDLAETLDKITGHLEPY